MDDPDQTQNEEDQDNSEETPAKLGPTSLGGRVDGDRSSVPKTGNDPDQ